MKKIYLFLIAMMTITIGWSQTVVFSDNFDSYTAGGMLAAQNPTNWTTWSETPGGSDDATISTDIAVSTPNSLKITGTNDIIYPFGNLTTGHYLVSFKWYVVASGNGAYFNMLHTLAGTSSEWAFECYMDATGNGVLYLQDVQNPFTFMPNTWMDVQLDVNLDLDTIMLTIAGNQIKKWQFSSLAAATGQGIKRLAAINFYAGCLDNLTGGTNFGTYYVDDFSVIDQQQSSSIETPTYANVFLGPNPAGNSFSVNTTGFVGTQELLLYDMSGKLLKSELLQNGVNSINVEHFSAGFYLIKVLQDEQTIYTAKLIKK